jgi:hypothetical protein
MGSLKFWHTLPGLASSPTGPAHEHAHRSLPLGGVGHLLTPRQLPAKLPNALPDRDAVCKGSEGRSQTGRETSAIWRNFKHSGLGATVPLALDHARPSSIGSDHPGDPGTPPPTVAIIPIGHDYFRRRSHLRVGRHHLRRPPSIPAGPPPPSHRSPPAPSPAGRHQSFRRRDHLRRPTPVILPAVTRPTLPQRSAPADRPTMGQLHSVIRHYYPREDPTDHPEYTVTPESSSPEQIRQCARTYIFQTKIKTNFRTNNLCYDLV